MSKRIKITCTGSELVPLARLLAFQGNLKTLADADFQKLRAGIEQYGFSFPIGVWKQGAKRHIIDGHQRLATVSRMLEDEWTLPGGKLPVYWVEARNEKEAKAKVLLAASQYGRYSQEGVREFVLEAKLDWAELKKEVAFPMLGAKGLDALFGTGEKDAKGETVSDELEFKVLIVCKSEKHQRELLNEFEKRKIECRALMF